MPSPQTHFWIYFIVVDRTHHNSETSRRALLGSQLNVECSRNDSDEPCLRVYTH
eukprot:m.15413 g.15413  ORF g.15413 m.15413 type:complete len:54 (+) comp4907_c0_seq1:1243-1404(+)